MPDAKTTLKVTLPPLHAGQELIRRSNARFKVLASGRRWGKTLFGAAMCTHVALTGGRAWWVAPTYKVARVGWRSLEHLASQVPLATIHKGDKLIVYPGGGEVQVRSADDPDSLRGDGLNLAVLDEAAYMKESAWFSSLRPALSDKLGAAMFLSSPAGRNWFWRVFQMGLRLEDDYESWHLPTSDNPFIPASEIEAARNELPEAIFEQEYLAVFLEDEGAVFRNIGACMNAPLETSIERHFNEDSKEYHHIICGIDWGKQNDFTAISIGCATCRHEIARDRFNRIDYHFQWKRLDAIMRKWHVNVGLVELNSIGEPSFEALVRSGLNVRGFQTTASSKPPLIENLALALEQEEWQFQDDDVWRSELEGYERKVSPVTGRSAYMAPTGLHDDTVIARALMVRQASGISASSMIDFV